MDEEEAGALHLVPSHHHRLAVHRRAPLLLYNGRRLRAQPFPLNKATSFLIDPSCRCRRRRRRHRRSQAPHEYRPTRRRVGEQREEGGRHVVVVLGRKPRPVVQGSDGQQQRQWQW